MATLIQQLSAPIRRQVLNRRRRVTGRRPEELITSWQGTRQWTLRWFGVDVMERCDGKPQGRILANWKKRWREQTGREPEEARRRTARGEEAIPEDLPPDESVLTLHKGLRKAESALLVQARTGCIGLAEFLHRRKVPGVDSPLCRCGENNETAKHVVRYCALESGRDCLRDTTGTAPDWRRLIGTAQGAQRVTRWLILTDRIPQFSLAGRLLFSVGEASV